MALTKDQRQAKFNSKNIAPGLVSRGNKKLTIDEQKNIFLGIDSVDLPTKLSHLRSIRESLLSTNNKDTLFEIKVYERSVLECINQEVYEILPHLLAHLCFISSDSKFTRLYLIILSNMKQFNEALKFCNSDEDHKYLSSLMINDFPLYLEIISLETEPLIKKLMEQAKIHFRIEKARLKIAYN